MLVRQSVVRTGEAFSGGSGDHNDTWQYNDRNELIRTDRFTGTTPGSGTAINDLDRLFTYDPIGNRLTSKAGDADDPNVPVDSYTSNNLNQYPEVAANSPFVRRKIFHDADGNLSQMYAVG